MKIQIRDSFGIPGNCSDRCSPVFVNDKIVTLAGNGKNLTIWKPTPLTDKKISLIGHEKVVTAFNISPKDQNYLCTCSEDKVILWNVSDSTTNAQDKTPSGVTFGYDLGYIEYCAFSWDNKWVALCKEKEIWIIKLEWKNTKNRDFDISHHSTLQTNCSHGNLCAFSSQDYEILVTVEDSSYFKVWSVQSGNMLHKTVKFGMHTITNCIFAKNPPYLLLGTTGGFVYVYSVRKASIPNCLINVNVAKTFSKVDDSKVSPRNCELASLLKQKSSNETLNYTEELGEIGCIIFSIYLFKERSDELKSNFCATEDANNFWETSEILWSILSPGATLVVCSNLGIALYNSNSWECQAVLKVADLFSPSPICPRALPLLSFMVIGGKGLDNFTCVAKMSLGDCKVQVSILQALEFDNHIYMDVKQNLQSEGPDSKSVIISVIPLEPVYTKSPLRYQVNLRLKSVPHPYGSNTQKKTRKNKSSGYGKAPRDQMFCPMINRSKSRTPRIATISASMLGSVTSLQDVNKRSTDLISRGPPLKVGKKVCLWKTSGTAVHLAVSGDGVNLACSSTASLISILRFQSIDPEKSCNLLGHNGTINSVHFSFDSQWLISASSDSTAKVWDWRHKHSILSIDYSVGKDAIGSKCKKEPTFGSSVTQARFYYMDQFILVAIGGYIELFSHLLHEDDPDKKLSRVKGCPKRVCQISVPTQHITCFTAANQFHSYLVLCCCSNRSLQVYDFNAEKYVLEVSDIHTRPAHHLVQMEGSSAMSHPPGMYNLYVTAALCDGSKLWDLRSARCIQKYCQHVNRAYTSGVDISPCGRFVAVGSEDKYVYLYDTRKCADYLGKLGGLGDVVMDVKFNPCEPILAAAALNSCIASYFA